MQSGRRPITINIREAGGAIREVVLSGEQERYQIGRQDTRVGVSVDLEIVDRHVSRRHCAVSWDAAGERWMISDLASGNGTMLGDQLLDSNVPVEIPEGGKVKIGATVLFFSFNADGTIVNTDGDNAPTMIMAARAPEVEATVLMAPEGDADATVIGEDHTVLVRRRPPPADMPVGDAATEILPAGDGVAATVLRAPAQAAPPADSQTVLRTEIQPMPLEDIFPETAAPAGAPPPDTAAPVAPAAGPAPAQAPAEAQRRNARQRKHEDIVMRGIARKLVNANYVDGEKAVQLCKEARERGRTFFRELAEDNTIKYHEDIYKLVSDDLPIPLIATETNLMEQAVSVPWLTFALAARRGAVVLVGGEDDEVRYATIDPYDVALVDWVRRQSGKRPVPFLVRPSLFGSALQRLKNQGEDKDESANVLVVDVNQDEEIRISTQIDKVDVPLLVNYFLQRAFAQGASDIHIEPTEDFLLVRNRVDGILHEDTTLPAALHPEISSRVKIISGMDVAEKRRPQDGRISSLIRNNPIDVRVSSYPTIYGEKVVMRLLDKNALRPSPEHLGMFARDLRLLYDKLGAPFGLVMISGPTGSGKTTTLYSCLSAIDKRAKNVLTVEDPVEYRLKGVHQMQVNEKIGLTFASGLRTMLRQDPDVIMVGECRDTETAAMAIQASLTGHIVFSTIHTNDAIGVITRMLDMGIDKFLVANALTLTIAQRLVRRVCRHCQTTIRGEEVLRRLFDDGISSERLTQLGIEIDGNIPYVVGAGCIHCRNTGYQGRQAVFEVFEMSNAARAAIMSEDFSAETLRKAAKESGMTTLISHGLAQIEEGLTTHAEVIRVLGEVS